MTMESKKLTQVWVARMDPPETDFIEVRDLVLPGFRLRVRPSGRKTYSVVTPRFFNKETGKVEQIRFPCGRHGVDTLAEARERAREALRNVEQGIDPREKNRAANKPPKDIIDQVVKDFIRLYTGSREEPISERTKKENARALRGRFVPYFKGRGIGTISRKELRGFLREMAEEAPALAHRTQALLPTLFNWAIEEEILSVSPAARLKAVHKPKSRKHVLKDKDIKLLWPVFQAQGNPFGPFFQMCLLTAARRTEVATMRWEDIEDAMWRLSNTKTGAPRDIPLSTTALEILSNIPRQGEYVFTSSGRAPVSGFSKAKKAVDLDANIEPWTIHDLRRTAATHMAELKTPRIVVMAVLGHSDSSVTSIYDQYDYLEEKTKALQLWADKIERLTGGAPSNVTSLAEAKV